MANQQKYLSRSSPKFSQITSSLIFFIKFLIYRLTGIHTDIFNDLCIKKNKWFHHSQQILELLSKTFLFPVLNFYFARTSVSSQFF